MFSVARWKEKQEEGRARCGKRAQHFITLPASAHRGTAWPSPPPPGGRDIDPQRTLRRGKVRIPMRSIVALFALFALCATPSSAFKAEDFKVGGWVWTVGRALA